MYKKFRVSDVEIAARMRDKGVPLHIGEFEQDLIVRQDGGLAENSIATCYLTSNYIGSIITAYIQVICNRSLPFRISGFELRLRWKDAPAILLPDPADLNAPQIYRFSEYDAARFDKSQIIVQSNRTLRRGQFLDGYLLAVDPDPIPPAIHQGARVTATLTITDQFSEAHSHELFLWVDRAAERQRKPMPPKSRRRLFDQPDKKIGKLHTVAAQQLAKQAEIAEGGF